MNNILNGHVGFKDIPLDWKAPIEKKDIPRNKHDEFLDAIFAVDSTGHPCSDAMVYLERDTRPEVKDYIARNLLVKRSDITSSGYDNADDVAAMMQQFGESDKDYRDRLVKTATEHLQNKEI